METDDTSSANGIVSSSAQTPAAVNGDVAETSESVIEPVSVADAAAAPGVTEPEASAASMPEGSSKEAAGSTTTAAATGEVPGAEVQGETVEAGDRETQEASPSVVQETEAAVTEAVAHPGVDDIDEGSDMNVGSDGFDTPPPAAGPDAPSDSTTAEAIPTEAETPAAAASQPKVIPPASLASASSALATAAANEEAASAFLKQTFDSFSKTGAVPSGPASHQNARPSAEDYRNSLKKRIEKDRRDGDAWLALISDTNNRADLEEMRRVYEDFFAIYPSAARQWQDYAAMELANSEFEKVESIFTRCLRTTPSTDLWRFYLSYTRRVNPLPPPSVSKGPSGEDSERERVRKTIEGAYDFALRFVGQSRDAGDVWREYISLLKERETSNQWQAGQKMDDIRRAYQRAVAVPLANVEMIWREYDAYENGLNRITAKKFLAEKSPAYMTARTVFREMKTLTDGLYRPNIAKVPSWAALPSLSPIVSPLTIARDRGQSEAWKKYLSWEEGNPLQLEDEQTVQSRVLVAYRKATMHLRFFPEIWFLAANYCTRVGRVDEALTWLKSGIDACTGSFLLHFAYVELGEKRSQLEDCSGIFTSLIEWIHGEIEALEAGLNELLKEIDDEGEQIKAEAAARRRDEGASDVVEGEEREELRKLQEVRDGRKEKEREKVRPKVEELKEHASLVWIKYMHFVRRHEGQRPSRAIFARARKSKYCTWQVFEANALMEYHCSKEVAVATKVFELALKSYGDDEAFVVRYLDFLLSINDDNNARALFERTVGTFPPERARPIWDRWSEYEYSFGDAASIAKIDERLTQVYPEEMPVKRLVDRNSYMDLDVVGPRDLGLRTVIGGSSAAERAVAASREIAQEAAGAGMMVNLPTGPSGRLHAVEEEQLQPPVKRARFGASPVPIPTGPSAGVNNARTVPPPRGVKRSVSPPARFVPPPRGEPPVQQAPPPPVVQQAPPPPQYIEIPEGVLYFLDCLPNAASFDGPRFPAEDIIESLMRSSLPLYDFSKSMANGNAANAQARAGRRRSELHVDTERGIDMQAITDSEDHLPFPTAGRGRRN